MGNRIILIMDIYNIRIHIVCNSIEAQTEVGLRLKHNSTQYTTMR